MRKVNLTFNTANFVQNSLFIITSILLVLLLPDNTSSLFFIGIYNVILSIIMIFRFKDSGIISLLMGILLLINISYASSMCLNYYSNLRTWQFAIYDLPENIINIKSYTLFTTFLLLSINKSKKSQIEIKKEDKNTIIFFLAFFILVYALIFGFDRGSLSVYSYNTNALYEYAIVFYVVAWIYAGDSKILKKILFLYSIVYVLQGILFGDRSSSFPMMIVDLLLLTKNKINMKSVLIVGIVGILLGNFLGVYRNNKEISFKMINDTIQTGLNVNTISFSAYAGTQIIRYSEEDNDKISHLINYSITMFTGGSEKYTLNINAKDKGYYNLGGGLSSSYFYYWFGYLGSIIGGLIYGLIISKIFNKNGKLYNLMKVMLIAFSLRWFIYFPIAFFRTSIIIPFIVLVFFQILSNILKKKSIFSGINK